MMVLGIQLFLMGLIAEMLVRTYHESQGKPTYTIKTKINFEDAQTQELRLAAKESGRAREWESGRAGERESGRAGERGSGR
jgi:hypothetical protein